MCEAPGSFATSRFERRDLKLLGLLNLLGNWMKKFSDDPQHAFPDKQRIPKQCGRSP